MKTKHILTGLLLLLSGQQLNAQVVTAYQLTSRYIDSLDFYNGLHTLLVHEADYDTDRSKNSYLQMLATSYAFNGILDSAIWAMDRATTGGVLRTEAKAGDTTSLLGYRVEDARQYILNQASKRRVIMVNEAHHVPQHRSFAKSLLQGLYDKGYRYLCLEALPYDSLSSPLITADFSYSIPACEGIYTKESCFGELIREAKRIGYYIYGYEPTTKTKSPAERDSLMAVNLDDVLGVAASKALILVGYAHNSKTSNKNLYYFIKKRYGIDALSVNQTRFYQHTNSYYESALYISFCKQFNISTPSVLINPKGAVENRGDSIADVFVYAPRVSYHNGKPDWLLEQGKRKPVDIKIGKHTTIVKAYYFNEVSFDRKKPITYAIPVDQLVVEKPAKHQLYQLYLPQGVFLIHHLSPEGKITKKYYQQVK